MIWTLPNPGELEACRRSSLRLALLLASRSLSPPHHVTSTILHHLPALAPAQEWTERRQLESKVALALALERAVVHRQDGAR